MVRLTLNDFKQIEFEAFFPAIINDLIVYLTGFKITEYDRIQKAKARIDSEQKEFQEKFKQARAVDPGLKEEAF